MFSEMEYDHLDYSRPGSSWKPNYQRMPNPFLKDNNEEEGNSSN